MGVALTGAAGEDLPAGREAARAVRHLVTQGRGQTVCVRPQEATRAGAPAADMPEAAGLAVARVAMPAYRLRAGMGLAGTCRGAVRRGRETAAGTG
jgi:hypothetical protein